MRRDVEELDLIGIVREELLETAIVIGRGVFLEAHHPGRHRQDAVLAEQANRLAIVPAVGMTGATRSHFEAQDYLEQGGIASDTGWANRLLAHRPHPGDATAIAVGNTLPRSLAGTAPALVLERNGEVGIARKAPPPRRTQIIAAFDELYHTQLVGFLGFA